MDDQHTPQLKFSDPSVTAKGEPRARVEYKGTKTLWFNTGTLCNIECEHCYIESSPTNDRLSYLSHDDVIPFLDELDNANEASIEIGITGGEPFMAPDILPIISACLSRGHSVLVLTNAMKPMMRNRIQAGLKGLRADHGRKLTIRVSLDHYMSQNHDKERGPGSFAATLRGLKWLHENEFNIAVAGRSLWDEDTQSARSGFSELFSSQGIQLDCEDPTKLVIFPEMIADSDPPEITTTCWDILKKNPAELMCASQRMVVKRRDEPKPSVAACTLIPYNAEFDLGKTLDEARRSVPLNHKYCATFCVLGGGSCSA